MSKFSFDRRKTYQDLMITSHGIYKEGEDKGVEGIQVTIRKNIDDEEYVSYTYNIYFAFLPSYNEYKLFDYEVERVLQETQHKLYMSVTS